MDIHVGSISASAPSNTLVLTTTGRVVVADNLRKGLVLTNLSSSTIYLGVDGNASVLNSGITLLPAGGAWTMDEYNFNTGDIRATAHTDNSILSIQEFITRV